MFLGLLLLEKWRDVVTSWREGEGLLAFRCAREVLSSSSVGRLGREGETAAR